VQPGPGFGQPVGGAAQGVVRLPTSIDQDAKRVGIVSGMGWRKLPASLANSSRGNRPSAGGEASGRLDGRSKRRQGRTKIGEGDWLGFQTEDVLKGIDRFLFHIFHGNAPAK